MTFVSVVQSINVGITICLRGGVGGPSGRVPLTPHRAPSDYTPKKMYNYIKSIYPT